MIARVVHDVSRASSLISAAYQQIKLHGTKIATGVGVRVGESVSRDNISVYRYINTKAVLKDIDLQQSIEAVASQLNLDDYMLTHNVLHMIPGEFLDWQDYYLWNSDTTSQCIRPPVIKFFSIALTSGNKVTFKDAVIDVPENHGLEFGLDDVHSVPPVTSDQMWLVLGIAKHIDINSKINT